MFDILNLELEELSEVKALYEGGKIEAARAELNSYFKNIKSPKGFLQDRAFMKNYVRENYNIKDLNIIEASDKYINKEIVFNMKWDMERCHIPYQYEGNLDFKINPFGDPEWTYMLNRHKYWISYGQSYLITGENKYKIQFEEEVSHWIQREPLTNESKKTTWRTIEAGLRCRNWVKALEYFIHEGFSDESLIEKMLMSLNEHLEYILTSVKEDRYLSNWVILEHHGAIIAALYFKELKISKIILERSIPILERALEFQILHDGTHWEQSFMYHNEMVNCILDLIIMAERNNVKLPQVIYDKIKEMTKATLAIMKPNYTQSNYGDSDVEDLRDVLALGAVVLKDGELKRWVKDLPLEVAFTLGKEGIEEFEKLEKKEITFTSVALESSGNYIFRDKWGEEGSYTFFKCGHLGSGHGHVDLLHFDINYKGEDYLVDSGRYSYSDDEPLRRILKKPQSHNTTLVDNLDFTNYKDSWSSDKVSTPIKRGYRFGKMANFVEGAHLGYKELGVFVNRKVIQIKSNLWIIADEFFTEEAHEYKAYFNFKYSGLKTQGFKNLNRVIFNKNSRKLYLMSLDKVNVSVEKSYISEEYNRVYESERAVLSFSGEKDKYLTTLIHIEDEDIIKDVCRVTIKDWKGRVLDSKYAEAIKVTLGKGNSIEEYIVVNVHQEEPSGRKTYTVDGIPFYGRIGILGRVNEEVLTEVLAY